MSALSGATEVAEWYTPSKSSALPETLQKSEIQSRIALIDSRPLLRACVSRTIKSQVEDVEVLPYFQVDEFLEAANKGGKPADLIILHIGCERNADVLSNGGLKKLVYSEPKYPLMVLSDSLKAPCLIDAIGRGLVGYIPTTMTMAAAIAAIRLVLVGGTFIPPSALLKQPSQSPTPQPGSSGATTEPVWGGFTRRQMEVCERLRVGKSNKDIADELGINQCTVKAHIRDIMKKLGVTNRTQIAHLLMKRQRATAVSAVGASVPQ